MTEATIRVRVRLFAMQREQAGAREVEIELPAGATVEDAWAALVERHPVLSPGRSAVRFARNAEYASPEEVLADGDELACIPPVSGGAPSAGAEAHAEVEGVFEAELRRTLPGLSPLHATVAQTGDTVGGRGPGGRAGQGGEIGRVPAAIRAHASMPRVDSTSRLGRPRLMPAGA